MIPSRSWSAAVALLAVSLSLALCTPAAFADGDPASDFLATQSVFYPGVPATPSKTSLATLAKLIGVSARSGYGYKVAIIAYKQDLGAITEFFDQPKLYARFLYAEIQPIITGMPRGSLLIVMQRGFGIIGAGRTPAAQAALAKLAIPAHASPTQLTQAATDALYAIAAANGHPLAHIAPVTTAARHRKANDGSAIAIVAIVLALLAGVLVALRLRARHARADAPNDR
jgi:hypothetical protein